MRILVRAAGLAALVALMAGCAGDGKDIEIARRAQTQLVGLPKAKLLSCAGVPSRQAVANGAEYYTYSERPAFVTDGEVASLGPDTVMGDGVGLGLGIGVPAFTGASTQGCDATFVLRGGVVQQVTYPMGASLEQCGALVSNCLAP